VVGEVVPGVAVGGVVLADRAPLPLGQVRPPALPVADALAVLREAEAFGVAGGGEAVHGGPRRAGARLDDPRAGSLRKSPAQTQRRQGKSPTSPRPGVWCVVSGVWCRRNPAP